MNFATIDFETADNTRYSPCEIGITIVQNDQIVETKSWYIKPPCYPYFSPFNTFIHGIQPDQVKDAPTFPELWNEISAYLGDQLIIAHYTPFDISVIRQTMDYYKLPHPSLTFACSYSIAKKTWPRHGAYSLPMLCENLGINIPESHRAGADSLKAAHVALKAFQENQITSIDQLPEKLNITIGQLTATTYRTCAIRRIYDNQKRDMSRFVANPEKADPESIFYEKNIVFTGKLNSMQRDQAMQTIVDIGGHVSDTLTKETNFLVVGQQDTAIVGITGLSGKQKKAIDYAKKGADIEIVSEQFFIHNI